MVETLHLAGALVDQLDDIALHHATNRVQVVQCHVDDFESRFAVDNLVFEPCRHEVVELVHGGLGETHDRGVRDAVEDLPR